ENDAGARDAEQGPSPRPLMEDADGDAGSVQAASRNHEAQAVQQRVLTRRQFGAVGVAVEDGEEAHQCGGDAERRPCPERHRDGRTSNVSAAPSRIADVAMPYSMPGNGTPISPSMPPTAITIGKATGSSQIAGLPSCAPQRPTATIASTWSGPEIGCWKPLRKP